MPLTKNDISKKIAKTQNLTDKQAKATVNQVFDEIKNTLKNGDSVQIFEFGKFHINTRAKRKGRNPQTGRAITIKAHKALIFIPSVTIKRELKSLKK
jgi:DNA-binding protein HU-beta